MLKTRFVQFFINRNYFQVWISSLLVNTASYAFSLAVYWQTFRLTHSTFWVGTIVLLSVAPSILTAPIAGQLNDRYDRLLIAKYGACGAFLTSLILGLSNLLMFDSLLLTALLVTVFGIFVNGLNVSLNSAYPIMVQRDRLSYVVSVQNITLFGTQFLGSFLAVPLISIIGTAGVYILCGILSLLTVLVLSKRLIRIEQSQLRQEENCSFEQQTEAPVFDGSLLELSARSQLRENVTVYGILLTLIGLGALTGNLYLINQPLRPRKRSLRFFIVLSGLSALGLGFTVSPSLVLSAGFLAGLTQTSVMIMLQTRFQQLASEENRGRIMGFYTVCTVGISALFSWGYGGLAQFVKPGLLLMISGTAFLLLIALVFSFSRRIRWLLSML